MKIDSSETFTTMNTLFLLYLLNFIFKKQFVSSVELVDNVKELLLLSVSVSVIDFCFHFLIFTVTRDKHEIHVYYNVCSFVAMML